MSQPVNEMPTERVDGEVGRTREPPILRYLHVLWKHRFLIIGGTLLPALVVGAMLYFWPKKYTVTFVYERPLAESEYNVFLRRFYSSENLAKIIEQLQSSGVGDYAKQLKEARTEAELGKLVRFAVSPGYPRRLQTTDPETSELISAFEARLLYVDITGDSRRDMAAISTAITDNIEDILPVYEIRNALKESIQEYKVLAAEIEDNRFTDSLELAKEKEKLQRLTGLSEGQTPAGADSVILQFQDVRESQEFLPLPYQVRAVQSKIIELEESLQSDREKYDYYLKIVALNDQLLGVVEASILKPYTVGQFLTYLDGQKTACEDESLRDYLNSYIRKTQNLILVNTRAGEQPVVYAVSKGIFKRTVLAAILGFMVASFVAVVLEYGPQKQHSSSSPQR